MNASTGQEVTQFYVRVPDRYLEHALDILGDIVWSPALRTDDVESERHVILEEIRMRDDTPDDLVHDVFAEALFPDHPLGREIAGSLDTISAMSRDGIVEYHRAHYHPENVVVAVAGNVDHDEVLALVEAKTSRRRRVHHRAPRVDGACARSRAVAVSWSARWSRHTSCSACARCRATTPTATRSRCSTRCSAAG